MWIPARKSGVSRPHPKSTGSTQTQTLARFDPIAISLRPSERSLIGAANRRKRSNVMEQKARITWAREAAVLAHHHGSVQLDRAYQTQTTEGSALAFRYG